MSHVLAEMLDGVQERPSARHDLGPPRAGAKVRLAHDPGLEGVHGEQRLTVLRQPVHGLQELSRIVDHRAELGVAISSGERRAHSDR
jgi:hypothetical protein